MAEYTFTWPAGPSDVVITGVFDNWTGSVPLVKQPAGDFSLTMPLPPSEDDKFIFKFIVDGEWVVSDNYEKDASGGPENNVIYISKAVANAAANAASSTFIPESGMSAKTQKVKAQPAPGSNKKGKKKKVKVKKRIRKDKKTGETTVLSEERTELNSEGEEESEEVSTTATSKEATPLPPQTANTEVAEAQEAAAPTPTVMPSKENQQITLGEPGIAIIQNAREIKEFSEVRDVDADQLNQQLNAELKAKEQNQVELAATAAAEAAEVAQAQDIPDVPKTEEPPVVHDASDVPDAAQVPQDKGNDDVRIAQSATEPAIQTEELHKADGTTVIEETGIITSAEQEAELIQRTLDPKVGGEAELLITEGNIPIEAIDDVQREVEKVADDALVAQEEVTEKVTDQLKKTEEPVVAPVSEPSEAEPKGKGDAQTTQTAPKTESKPTAQPQQKAVPKTETKPVNEEKKKKKGFFSKLKKIFN